MSLLRADARHIPLSDGCVQCVVTSPPYWGLRDYGTARWDGGDLACDHKQGTARQDGGRVNVNGFNGSAAVDSHKGAMNFKDVCGKCGARRIDQQIGLEQTPDAYVAELMAVFSEVRRVLRDDGVLWLNLGDSYSGTKVGNTNGGASSGLRNDGRAEASRVRSNERQSSDMARMIFRKEQPDGLKPKDLVGIPWRVAFALQADGWYLRSDIIWHKPNPMPESVTDRPTKAHEYVFLLTKRERYAYDAKAIQEQATGVASGNRDVPTNAYITAAKTDPKMRTKANLHAIGARDVKNARTVWTIATQPYSGAHFATMPEALVERCVLAGSKPGDRVFDPFGGSGTTARVALSLGRKAVSTELNPAYLALAQERTHVTLGLPLEVA
jgi:DNA modification methylase